MRSGIARLIVHCVFYIDGLPYGARELSPDALAPATASPVHYPDRVGVLVLTSLFLTTCLITSTTAAFQPLTPGNILVSYNSNIAEYTRTGELVQSIVVPYPGVDYYHNTRDVVIDQAGNIDVFNSNFNPYLSTYNTSQGTWSHRTYAGWSLANSMAYGGLATMGQYVYVPDMSTAGGESKGIVRFDLAAGTATRTATDIEPIDLNIGLDGLLYALYPGGVPLAVL